MSVLFQRAELLEESPAISDSRGIKREANRLSKSIDRWVANGRNSIIMYLGRFGSGKSTIISTVQAENEKQNKYEWLTFEIWRYADRQQAWDGFVIEVAKKLLRSDSKPRMTSNFIDSIDDERESGWQRSMELHKGKIFVVAIAVWLVASWFFWIYFNNSNLRVGVFVESFLKYGLSALFAVLAFLGLHTLFPKKRPAIKRVFQLQELLIKTLDELDKPLIVVVEDADRTDGNEGRIFMETLRTFLKNDIVINEPVIVIAPMSSQVFDIAYDDSSFQSALKVYDYAFYHRLNDLSLAEVSSYLGRLEIKRKHKAALKKAILASCDAFKSQLTMRKLKFILRELDEFIAAFPRANPCIAFILVLSKYITIATSSTDRDSVSKTLRDGVEVWTDPSMGDNNSIGPKLLWDSGDISSQPQVAASNIRTLKLVYASLQDNESETRIINNPDRSLSAEIKLDNKYLSII